MPQQSRANEATVRVRAVKGRSKLWVDVDPDKGKGHWRFKVQYLKKGGTAWGTYKKTYKTRTSKETRTLNFKKGTYRVVVKGKYGLLGITSGRVRLKK